MTKCQYCGRVLLEDERYCYFCDQDVGKKGKLYKPKPDDSKKKRTVSAYCVKCKKKVDVKNPSSYIMKNKMVSVKGTCPFCSTKVFRILGMKK